MTEKTVTISIPTAKAKLKSSFPDDPRADFLLKYG